MLVITSTRFKGTQWRPRHHHNVKKYFCDIKRYVMTSNIASLCLQNSVQYITCQIQILVFLCFKNTLELIWHFYDVLFLSYWLLCVIHNFGDLDLWSLPVIFLNNADIIPGYLHIKFVIIAAHLTKL